PRVGHGDEGALHDALRYPERGVGRIDFDRLLALVDERNVVNERAAAVLVVNTVIVRVLDRQVRDGHVGPMDAERLNPRALAVDDHVATNSRLGANGDVTEP